MQLEKRFRFVLAPFVGVALLALGSGACAQETSTESAAEVIREAAPDAIEEVAPDVASKLVQAAEEPARDAEEAPEDAEQPSEAAPSGEGPEGQG